MTDVLTKLRRRFILTTTGIAFLLIVIVACVYCFNVANTVSGEISAALRHSLPETLQPPSGEYPLGEKPNEQMGLLGEEVSPSNAQDSLHPNEGDSSSQSYSQNQGREGIDFFQGKKPLVFSVALNKNQEIIGRYSPAIFLDDDVLEQAIEEVFSAPEFSQEEGAVVFGKLQKENLYYKVRTSGDITYLALADGTQVDVQVSEAIVSSLILASIALILTFLVSIFLARIALRPVEEAWKKQNQFIADASHELKTPLTIIMANTEIVRSDSEASASEYTKWLDGTMEESIKLQGLIADLLLLASLDDENNSPVEPANEIVDLSELVENTIMSFEAIAYEKDISLESVVEPGLCVCAEESRVARIPELLIDNACKYSKEGGSVSILLKKQEEKGILRVSNTGSRILEEELSFIFDRFYRADKARSSEVPGFGLGLSIAQSIMHEVKGTISVENLEKDGVAFTATFPLTRRGKDRTYST